MTRSFEEWGFVLYPPSSIAEGFLRRHADEGIRVVLIDAPADAVVRLGPPKVGDQPPDELAEQIRKAHGLIVVWPIDRVDGYSPAGQHVAPGAANRPEDWVSHLGARASAAKRRACPHLANIVVAFSCFDRELATLGPNAAAAAFSADYVRRAIADTLRRNPVFVHTIRAMARWVRRVDLMAVSSFGLIAGYGETNWDAASMKQLIEPSGGGKLGSVINGARNSLSAEIADLWLPVFAADPVIRCTTGRRHRLMFAANSLLNTYS